MSENKLPKGHFYIRYINKEIRIGPFDAVYLAIEYLDDNDLPDEGMYISFILDKDIGKEN